MKRECCSSLKNRYRVAIIGEQIECCWSGISGAQCTVAIRNEDKHARSSLSTFFFVGFRRMIIGNLKVRCNLRNSPGQRGLVLARAVEGQL